MMMFRFTIASFFCLTQTSFDQNEEGIKHNKRRETETKPMK